LNLIVEDMTCNHCVATIEGAVKKVNGVKKVKIDLKSKMVEVSGNFSENEVFKAIENVGYTPKDKI